MVIQMRQFRGSGRIARGSSARRLSPLFLVLVVALAWAALMAILAIRKHDTLHSQSFDLAIFDQLLWNTTNGHPFEVSFYRQGTQFAHHFSPALALFTPLYWIWSDVRILLVAQATIIALVAPCLWWAASHRLRAPGAAVVLGLAALVHPTSSWLSLADFHPDILLMPLIPLAFALIWQGQISRALAVAGAMLLVKEDAAAVVFGIGLYLATMPGRRLLGLGLGAAALLWFVGATQVAIPHFRGGEPYPFAGRYRHLGADPAEILWTGLTQPSVIAALVLSPSALQYVVNLLAPLAALPLFSPRVLLAAAPAIVGTALSNYDLQRSLALQYAAAVVPVLLVAAIDGAANVRDWAGERAIRAGRRLPRPLELDLALLMLASTALVFVRDNGVSRHWAEGSFSQPPQMNAFLFAKDLIPPDASLAASNTLGPHFAHRPFLILFPPGQDPSGLPETSRDLRPFDSRDPEFVIVDTNWDRYMGTGLTPLRSTVEETISAWGYQRVLDQDGIVLLSRARPRA